MYAENKARTCSNCNEEKAICDFYSKGLRVDSKCKVCAKNIRNQRYRAEKNLRNKKGRLMNVKNIIECDFKDKNKSKYLKNTVDEILKAHLVKVISKAYKKGNKDAA